MSVLTSNYEPRRKEGDLVDYPVAANTIIYKGQHVVTRGDGYAYPLRAPAASQPDVYLGIADDTANNLTGGGSALTTGGAFNNVSAATPGTAGAIKLNVRKSGTYVYPLASATQAIVGQPVYGADANTLETSSTNAVLVGYVSNLVDSGDVRVRIDRAVQ